MGRQAGVRRPVDWDARAAVRDERQQRAEAMGRKRLPSRERTDPLVRCPCGALVWASELTAHRVEHITAE